MGMKNLIIGIFWIGPFLWVGLGKLMSQNDTIPKGMDLTLYLQNNDWDGALKAIEKEVILGNFSIARESLELIQTNYIKRLDRDEINFMYLILGDIHYNLGNRDSLEIYLQMVEKVINSTSPQWPLFLIGKATLLQMQGRFLESIEWASTAAKFFEENRDFKNLFYSIEVRGDNYFVMGQFENAKDFYKRSLNYQNSSSKQKINPLVLNNLGACFNNLGNIDSALFYYNWAYEVMVKSANPLAIAQNLNNRANILEKQEKYEEAEKLFLETYQLCKEHSIQFGMILSLTNLGNLKRLQKDFAKSLAYLRQAEEIIGVDGYKRELGLIYERRARTYRDLKDFEKAFENQALFKSINDSLLNEKIQLQAVEMKEKFESLEKEKEILELKEGKSRTRFILYLLIFGLISAFLGIGYFRATVASQKNKNENLELTAKIYEKEILNKDHELATLTMQMVVFQNQLKEIQAKILKTVSLAQGKLTPGVFEAIFERERENFFKKEFQVDFAKKNDLFYKRLLKIYPDLSPSELEVCAYLRMNMQTKDISDITNRSVRTVENLRTSIRTKMKLNPSENLKTVLMSIKMDPIS